MAVRLLMGCYVVLLACGGCSRADPIVGTWVYDMSPGSSNNYPVLLFEFREDGSYTQTIPVIPLSDDVSYDGTWAKTSDGYTLSEEEGETAEAKIADGTLILTVEDVDRSFEMTLRRDDKK